jgi:amino acid transporter
MSQQTPKLKRSLGRLDLTLMMIVAVVNLNALPVVAGAGPSALSFWALAFLLFFIPEAIAVLELSKRYPHEGGVYLWTKSAFGDLHGFFSGWCYWTNNIFYVPTLLFYLVGFSAYIGGEKTLWLGQNRIYLVAVSITLLWAITALNILGLGVGKWIQNTGAAGTFLTTAVIVGVAVIAINSRGLAAGFTPEAIIPGLGDWRALSLFSIVCFNYVGLELGPVMADEIKDPGRNIPRAVITAGVFIVLLYLLCTFSLQAAIPSSEIGAIEGILQAVSRVTEEINLPMLLTPIALLLSLNVAGNTSAWVGGAARVPFVIGLDRYLPDAMGKTHAKYNTPHIALIVQAAASTVAILIGSLGGSKVAEIYLVLLQTAVIIQLIPFLYMFASLILVRSDPEKFEAGEGFFRRSWPCYAAGAIGFFITAIGIVLAFIPPESVENVWSYEIKIVLGSALFIAPAALFYQLGAAKIRTPSPETSRATTD